MSRSPPSIPLSKHACVCLRCSRMCVFAWGHIALHRSNPTLTLLHEATDRQRKTRSIRRVIVNETLPCAKKKSGKREWQKKRGKKTTAGSKPQPGLSFMGKYFRKAWFHKRQTHRQRQHTQTRHFSNPQGHRRTHLVTSHAKMLIEPQMLLI